MNYIYLYHALQFIKDFICILVIFLVFDKISWRTTSLKDYLKCPYFYLMLIIDELIKLTVNGKVLSMVLLSMSYIVFTEAIRRHLDDIQ